MDIQACGTLYRTNADFITPGFDGATVISEAGVLHVRQGGPPTSGGPLLISPARRGRPEQLQLSGSFDVALPES